MVRVMPNVAVEVREGVLCFALSDRLDADQAAEITGLLRQLGRPIELDDGLIDAATAVMGCSPAYVALLAEALIDAGVAEGLPLEEATELVNATLAGTAELFAERDHASVRNAVASPGGSTEAGLEALQENEFEQAVKSAVDASLEKMRG